MPNSPSKISIRKPHWLRRRLPAGPDYENVRSLIQKSDLHTVCQEAKCPNQFECFSHHTATFLILGSRCTRNCGFCSVESGPDGPPDPDEPLRVARAAARLKLRHVVITSVTRDDLPDGGAGHFAATIAAIRRRMPRAAIEVLIPDFNGDTQALNTVLQAAPNVLNHNIETVPRLYATVRPQAIYRQSLKLLGLAARLAPGVPTKSGLMLGLGETDQEIRLALTDLRQVDCRMLTLGQYLQPTTEHLSVARFVTPEAFSMWREEALAMGFEEVASGPFVRSSYHARELYQAFSN